MSISIITIRTTQSADVPVWDLYVHAHPNSTLYQLSGWKKIIEKTYGHKTYYLMAIKSNPENGTHNPSNLRNSINLTNKRNQVVGILPLVHLNHFIFGNSLISVPFFDMGSIMADDEEVEKALLTETVKLAQKLKANNIEFRHTQPIKGISEHNPTNTIDTSNSITYAIKSHKVRMILDLPDSSEKLMKSFKSKLRSQIKKPLKEGLTSKIGGVELLDDFYTVFCVNMRDLGSPVHSKKMMYHVLMEFPEKAGIVMVYKDNTPIACSLFVGFKDTLENPWASALRKYSRLSPNMLLYWTMLEYACDNGYSRFDFGRSTPGEGTYKFKEQWGATPTPLHWHYISLNGKLKSVETSEKSKFDKAIQYWQKLPVSLTKVIGPMIRKHIGL